MSLEYLRPQCRLNPENPNHEVRVGQIRTLVSLIREGGADCPDAISLVKKLLSSDPLSDQQAGVVARTIRDSGDDYDLSEAIAIISGDWEQILRILTKNPKRAQSLAQNLKLTTKSGGRMLVYREMDVDLEKARLIKRNGLVPAGIVYAGNLDQFIGAHLRQTRFISTHDERIASFLLIELPVYKAQLFRGIWDVDEFGLSSAYKLGHSTTTYENLRNRNRIRHGRILIELSIDSSKLVREGVPGWLDDEHTVLYDIDPKDIVGVFDARNLNKDQVWRLVSKNPIERQLAGIGRRLA